MTEEDPIEVESLVIIDVEIGISSEFHAYIKTQKSVNLVRIKEMTVVY